MTRKVRRLIQWGITIVLVGGLGAWIIVYNMTPGKYDEFAQCLKDKKVTFFGAFWCPHCQSQKRMFGKSQKLLPYIECSTPDGKGQTPECTDKKVTGYPTWEFADGTRESGEVSFERLAEKSGCQLPS